MVAVSILPMGGRSRRKGPNQPIGDAHDGIRHRIAKIGPDELE